MAVDVLVVDDNEIERAGRAAVLRERGHRVRAVDWAGVEAGEQEVDVVLVLVRRDVSAFDRWDRLRTIGRLDGLGGPSARVVALTEDATPVTPLARLRLLRAGAAEVHVAGQLATGALLDALVRVRVDCNRLDTGSIGRIEFGPRCDPSAVVDHVLTKAEEDEAYLRAFRPEVAQNQSGLTRRRAHTLRVRVANLGDLRSPAPCGGGPVRDLSLPRWNDMVRFVNLCRLWDPADPAT